MTLVTAAVLAVLAGIAAAVCVRRFSHTDQARRLWWPATLAACLAVIPAASGPAPVATSLAGAGLMAAAVVDAVEHRIPTAVAHGTTVASLALLLVHAGVTGEWAMVGWAVLLTAGLVLAFGAVWLGGGTSIGDVRLAGALLTAMTRGFPGLVALLYAAFAVAGATLVLRRVLHSGGSRLPTAPALAAGWLFSITVA